MYETQICRMERTIARLTLNLQYRLPEVVLEDDEEIREDENEGGVWGIRKLFQFVHWRGDFDLAPYFGITLISPTPQPPTLVYWRAPLAGSAKINTDGCVKDRFTSGGVVIRDHNRRCIRAFSAGYGDIFILEAELRAILQRIELARRMGLVDLWIETDSTLAVHCISYGGVL
ncbi:RNase H domain-containing protein [Abeliophyllum distichum]|uniref:RNase H domain-containing protein n=1 Tax=Abeliophyllum distichum TaxID=126358 RepID=A0ABD1TIZ4_9LAMI